MHKYVKVWLATIVILLAVAFGANYGHKAINGPITERTSWNATLVTAYEYGDRCGYKGHDTCSAWKGRFKEQITGLHFDKEISGFLYHSYIDGGRRSIDTFITLSKEDFGFKTPWYGDMLCVVKLLTSFLGLFIFLMGMTIPSMIKEDKLSAAREEYKAAAGRGNYQRQRELEEEYGWYEIRHGR